MGYRGKRVNPQLRSVIWVTIAVIIFAVSFFIGNVIRSKRSSEAASIPNDVRVDENTELTYYLKVKYDGIDRVGIESSDSATADIQAGKIIVSDTIPDGLEFLGFVTTDSGVIGATLQSDEVTPCPGTVVDSSGSSGAWEYDRYGNLWRYRWHGLTYTIANRNVSFTVKDLQAGCQLVVGIRTKTPSLPSGVTRMDFYNTAEFDGEGLGGKSNTTHHYIGRDVGDAHKVTYEYTGDIPSNAPELPTETRYAAGQTVYTASTPSMEGYSFSGWYVNGSSSTSRSFTMPSSDVTITGYFTPINRHTVTYVVTGAPDGYMPPAAKEYDPYTNVTIDSLAAGDIVYGYKFSGWTSTDVSIYSWSKTFSMPTNKDVVITGSFAREDYDLSYEFIGDTAPDDASSLLPATESYYPGETVTIADEPEATGYIFLGWDRKSFRMPEENVAVKGEWAAISGVFRPTISYQVVDLKDKYYKNETVRFEITVTNPDSVTLENVNVGLELDGVKYVSGNGYTIRSDQLAAIATLGPNESAKLYAEFVVTENANKTIESFAELLSASATNGDAMDISDEARASYRKSASFDTVYWEDDPVFTGIDLGRSGPLVLLTVLGAIGGTIVVLRKKQ